MLWAKTAKLALEQGHEVLISMFETETLPPKIQELKDKGAKFVFRRRYYPGLKQRLEKKLKNKLSAEGNKKTYHDYINDFGADRVFFSLGAGDEIARDTDDLMVFVKQTNIPYFVFCHNVSTVPENNEELNENLRISFDKADKVFFTSSHQKEMYEHQMMSTIDNGIVASHPLNINEVGFVEMEETGSFNMAMVGSLVVRRKGQDMVLKVLSGEKWKSRNFVLNIYGKGEDEGLLKRYVGYYGLEDKVHFKGYVNNTQDVWKHNHIHIIPTRQDSGPITLFEAMCCGRAIVGTRMGSMPEYISEGENGFLCEPGSYDSLAEAMEHAWAKRNDWLQMGQKSLQIVKDNYDFEPEKTMLNYLIAAKA